MSQHHFRLFAKKSAKKQLPPFQINNYYYLSQVYWLAGMYLIKEVTQLIYTLSQSLKAPESSENIEAMKELFGIEFVSRVHCAESGEESSEAESVYSLKCHISHEVNHLHEGLKHGLKSELEKFSPSLGRSAVYIKESRINDLPKYMTVQFVRFFYKRELNQKAKILGKANYPLELDVYDLCFDELHKKLEMVLRHT